MTHVPGWRARATAMAHIAWVVVRRAVRDVSDWVTLVFGWALGWPPAQQHSKRLAVPPAVTPQPCRIYAFNEGEEEGFHKEIPVPFFVPDTWESDVKSLTGWDRPRVEVRYTMRHKKYRMVLRPGDACAWPPYAEPAAPVCRVPRGVLSARLQGPPGSAIDTDVTARVLKYQGPKGDFHAGLGLTVRLWDMFPFDDHGDNALRFTHLRIIDTGARVLDLPYDKNPAMKGAVVAVAGAANDDNK